MEKKANQFKLINEHENQKFKLEKEKYETEINNYKNEIEFFKKQLNEKKVFNFIFNLIMIENTGYSYKYRN